MNRRYEIVHCEWCHMDMERGQALVVVWPSRSSPTFGEDHVFCSEECKKKMEVKRIGLEMKIRNEGVF